MTRGKRLLSLCALVGALGAGCGDQNTYIMFERFELVGETRVFAGSGCMLAIEHALGSSGSSSSGGGLAGPDADFVVSEHSAGNAFVVQVSSGGEELVQRRYSEKTLLSGKRDQFTVTTHAGREFELTYWGGDDCDPPPSPEQSRRRGGACSFTLLHRQPNPGLTQSPHSPLEPHFCGTRRGTWVLSSEPRSRPQSPTQS